MRGFSVFSLMVFLFFSARASGCTCVPTEFNRASSLDQSQAGAIGWLLRALRSVNRLESSYMAQYVETSDAHAVAGAPISRRERKKGRTRADIYNAAMNLFLRRGFDSVTIEDICDSADVARATFFLHFPAKEALLIEYGNRANDELAAALAEYRGSATAAIRMALKMMAERAARHPDVVRLVIREVLARPRVLSEHDESAADLVNLLAT